MIIECLPDYAVRIASLPLGTYLAALENVDDLDRLASDPRASAAIAIASPHFGSRLLEDSASRQRPRFRATLLRYLSRMSARSTPFGLFAGIAIANFRDQEPLSVSEVRNWSARLQLDYEWLKAQRSSAPEDALVLWNAESIRRGSRLFSRRKLASDSRDGSVPSSINITPLVEFVASFTAQPVSLANLVRCISSTFDLHLSQAQNVTTALIDGGFVLTSLEAHVTEANPSVALRVESARQEAAENYVSALFTSGYRSAEAITAEKVSVARTQLRDLSGIDKEPFAADLFAKIRGTLPVRVQRDVVTLADMMWRASSKVDLAEYRDRFLRRYESLERVVPIVQLVDATFGLGMPKDPPSPKLPGGVRRNLAMLTDRACSNRWRELDVSHTAVDKFFGPPIPVSEEPTSFELAVQLLARDISQIESGNYRIALLPLVGTKTARASWLRFHADLRGQDQLEVPVAGGAMLADLTFVPDFERGWNLVRRPGSDVPEIAVGPVAPAPNVKRLPLSQVGVTVRQGRFELRSLLDDRPLALRNLNVVNMRFAPPLARLLWLLSLDGTREIGDFDWGPLTSRFFLPRLRHGRHILSRARWRFPVEELISDPSSYHRVLDEWKRDYDVPRWVSVGTADRLLLLDSEAASFAEQLHEEARRETGDYLVVSESLIDDVPLLLSGHTSEFVFSFLRRTSASAASLIEERSAENLANERQRCFAPGSEWTYLKAYGAISAGNALFRKTLQTELLPLLADSCDKWFFVRYADPFPHLRLRFHASSPEKGALVLTALTQFCTHLGEAEIIDRFELCCYERELERYRSRVLDMPDVETVFYFDSLTVLRALISPLGDLKATLLSAIDSFFDVLEFLNIPSAARGGISPSRIALDARGREIVRALCARRASVRAPLDLGNPLFETLSGRLRAEKVTAEPHLVGSLLHMHFNRFGLLPDSEDYAAAILRAVRLSIAERSI